MLIPNNVAMMQLLDMYNVEGLAFLHPQFVAAIVLHHVLPADVL